MADDLHYRTIADAARAIEAGELSPVELSEAYLHRIEVLDAALGGQTACSEWLTQSSPASNLSG